MAFSKYFCEYNISSRCIYQNVLLQLRLIRMLQNSCVIKHEKYFVLRAVVYCFTDENTKMQQQDVSTAAEKSEKLLGTSNFSFSHNVPNPLCHLFFILNAL